MGLCIPLAAMTKTLWRVFGRPYTSNPADGRLPLHATSGGGPGGYAAFGHTTPSKTAVPICRAAELKRTNSVGDDLATHAARTPWNCLVKRSGPVGDSNPCWSSDSTGCQRSMR